MGTVIEPRGLEMGKNTAMCASRYIVGYRVRGAGGRGHSKANYINPPRVLFRSMWKVCCNS